MELREFAEQVLFGETLEQKLAYPETLADEHPGKPFAVPAQPGRPANLRFSPGGSNFQLPGWRALEKEATRGQLLHFFANHELLATELMALVLLKFPDAPPEFRQGILRTLRDEQEHTRMYVGRLRKLGVAFGQYPVNGFFWRMVATMPTPLDYVSRLSLTFEQANLDYSKYYAGLFKQIGDIRSEALLTKIHEDEIGHVGYGLHWFRQWKEEGLSDWEAFQKQLPYPLSPSRAKAAPFDDDARRRAGLDESFIEELYVYSRSKGRTPGVYWFNPLAEARLPHGPGFTPNRFQIALARDLETVPQFLCRRDDVVLVSRRPRTAFLARWKNLGWALPEFEVLRDGRLADDSELRGRKIGSLHPWAWSPESLALLEPLRGHLTGEKPPSRERWEHELKPLFAKSWSASVLREFLAARKDRDWLCEDEAVGVMVCDCHEALDRIAWLRGKGCRRVVAKSLFGMAGNNMLRLWEPAVTEEQRAWIRNTLRAEGTLVIEPWLDRVLDFSLQMEMKNGRLRRVGFVKMINDQRGQFQASVRTPKFTQDLTPDVARFVHGASGDRLRHLYADLESFLEPKLERAGFLGALGVDAMVYRDGAGELRLKPIVEMNARYTMGRLLLELMRHAVNGRSGRMELIGRGMLKKQGHGGFTELAKALKTRHPVQWEEGDQGKILSGALCLNDPEWAEEFLAVWTVR